jgi:23S rRNA (guanosine2251-2'-O)-methyltransferase
VTGARSLTIGGRRTALEAVRAGLAIEIFVARGARDTTALAEVRAAADEAGIAVRDASRPELDRLARDHHGVVTRLQSPEELGERALAETPFDDDALVVVLDGVDDPQNLGAAARSAEAAGAAMLVTRTRRSAPVTAAAIRASAGALLHLPHARVANIARAMDRLRELGFTVVGLDEDAAVTVYDDMAPSGRVTLVVGSEGEGLARLTRERCDLLVRLPMRGRVGSLNASASLAAALFSYVVPSRTRMAGR